jgi:hypothetical protein
MDPAQILPLGAVAVYSGCRVPVDFFGRIDLRTGQRLYHKTMEDVRKN